LLADRNAVLLHSAGVIFNGQGLLFVGHSSAGKSTIVTMLKNAACSGAFDGTPLDVEILCDDRNILRRWPAGEQMHGTWSHGDVSDVSAGFWAVVFDFVFAARLPQRNSAADRPQEIWKSLLATSSSRW